MNKSIITRFFGLLTFVLALSFSLNSCFKDLPTKTIVYKNDFETIQKTGINVYDNYGLVDTPSIINFNGNLVFGRFKENLILLKVNNLPTHNLLKIEFDLYIHDQWDGDYIAPGNNSPDAWGMNIDNFPLFSTTFSNGTYKQSFPANYTPGVFLNPPKSDAWETNLPGACSMQYNSKGTTMYKMVKTTTHTKDSLEIIMNAVLQPAGNYCLKSWSIDNLIITVNNYQ